MNLQFLLLFALMIALGLRHLDVLLVGALVIIPAATVATGSTIPDGIAAIMVGLLLGFVAFQLAARNGDVLIGGQASATLRGRIGQVIAAQPGIVAITELLVTFIGPRRAWVVARVSIDGAMTGASVEALGREVEATLQRESPFIARVDLVARGR